MKSYDLIKEKANAENWGREMKQTIKRGIKKIVKHINHALIY